MSRLQERFGTSDSSRPGIGGRRSSGSRADGAPLRPCWMARGQGGRTPTGVTGSHEPLDDRHLYPGDGVKRSPPFRSSSACIIEGRRPLFYGVVTAAARRRLVVGQKTWSGDGIPIYLPLPSTSREGTSLYDGASYQNLLRPPRGGTEGVVFLGWRRHHPATMPRVK